MRYTGTDFLILTALITHFCLSMTQIQSNHRSTHATGNIKAAAPRDFVVAYNSSI